MNLSSGASPYMGQPKLTGEPSVTARGAQLFESSRDVWEVLDAYQHVQTELAHLRHSWHMKEEEAADQVEDRRVELEQLGCEVNVEKATKAVLAGRPAEKGAFDASVRGAKRQAEQRLGRLGMLERGWREDAGRAEREVEGLREELEDLELSLAVQQSRAHERVGQELEAVEVRVLAQAEQARKHWAELLHAARQNCERAKAARVEWQAERGARTERVDKTRLANQRLERRLRSLQKATLVQGTPSRASTACTRAQAGGAASGGGGVACVTGVAVGAVAGAAAGAAASAAAGAAAGALRRAMHIAEALGRRSMVSQGADAISLVTPEHNEWEGLQAGSDDAFIEAVEAYIEVSSSEQADRKQLQAWQKHAAAPFSEALMELVAMYRTAKPEPKPKLDELADGEAVNPSGGALTAGEGTVPQVSSTTTKPGGKKGPAGGAKKPRAAGSATAAQKRDSIRASAVFM